MADPYYYALLFLVWLVSAFILRPILRKHKKSTHNLPPSPPSLPIIGHIHHFYRPAFRAFKVLSDKYGPLLYLRLGAFRFVLVSATAGATEIFRTQDVTFSARSKSPFGDSIIFGDISFFNAPYGDYWRFMRKLTTSVLLGAQQMHRSRGIRREETLILLRKMIECAHKRQPVDVNDELTKFANDAICMMIMNKRCTGASAAENGRDMAVRAVELARKAVTVLAFPALRWLFFLKNGRELKNLTRDFDTFFEKMLREHEEKTEKEGNDKKTKDLMDFLLETYHDRNTEISISRNHLKAFIMDVFVGSTSTSAETMQWLMAEFQNHPEIFRKVREEIETVVGKDRLVEEADTPNLPYLQAVVKETLRLYPGLPVLRRMAREDCTLGEYNIPKNTTLLINLYAIMRDPKVWDNPNEFRPERFLDTKNDPTKKLNCEFVPFGGGRRTCPGENLTMAIIPTTIAALVQCFDFEVVDNKSGKDGTKVNMEVKSEIITNMLHPLHCIPTVHFNPFSAEAGTEGHQK